MYYPSKREYILACLYGTTGSSIVFDFFEVTTSTLSSYSYKSSAIVSNTGEVKYIKGALLPNMQKLIDRLYENKDAIRIDINNNSSDLFDKIVNLTIKEIGV
jgi:hypothetical protein